MTIKINTAWITDEHVIDLSTRYASKNANVTSSAFRRFFGIIAGGGVNDRSLIPVDNNDYLTGDLLIYLLTLIYYCEWFRAFHGTGTKLEDIYGAKIADYEIIIKDISKKINRDTILNGNDSLPVSNTAKFIIGGL